MIKKDGHGMNPGYHPGNPWVTCDMCGRDFRQSDTVKLPDGRHYCKHDFDVSYYCREGQATGVGKPIEGVGAEFGINQLNIHGEPGSDPIYNTFERGLQLPGAFVGKVVVGAAEYPVSSVGAHPTQHEIPKGTFSNG